MNILALDSSTKNFSLAVSEDEKIIASCDLVVDRVLESSIIPAIEKVLKKAKLPLEKIDGIAVGLGPGSFTSLRVGLSTVKALAFAQDKPIIGICSLDIIAQGIESEKYTLCVMTDARRNQIYWAQYRCEKTGWKLTGEYSLTTLEAALKKMKGKTLFAGDALALYQKDIRRIFKTKAVFADEKTCFPKARNLIALAYPKFIKKEYNAVDSLVPLYLYPEDCQVVRT